MANVLDVAEYILKKQGCTTAMKLQKLVYYTQAWSLVWDEKPLFRNKIEAWANGPVVSALYAQHRGKFSVCRGDFRGDPKKLNDAQRATVNAVLKHYGHRTSQWLSDLTHAEDPWKQARHGLEPGDRGSAEIIHAAMHEYYDSLTGA